MSSLPFVLKRVSTGPLLTPRPEVSWERGAVLNSAVWEENGKTYLFYRAIDHDTGWTQENPVGGRYYTSVGLATSDDGIHFERREQPVIPFGFMGGKSEAQDCRIVKIEGTYYLTYCLYDKDVGLPRPGYSVSTDLVHWEHRGELVPFADHGYNKNAALFPEKINGRFALLHRPEAAAYRHLPRQSFCWRGWSRAPITDERELPGVTLSFSDDLKTWKDTQVVIKPRRDSWDNVKVGPGAPPIRTAKGWLNVYHAVDASHTYRLGLALHDLKDPSIILKRQDQWILQPEADWEKHGDVDGAIFTCGALLRPDGTLRVYYAGADTVIGLAEGNVTEFLNQ
jgi:beta-1,2-mannobiose phosphorylase / 1,2-beta-oligomannan phosphorylase